MCLFIYSNYLFPSFQHFPILCFIKSEVTLDQLPDSLITVAIFGLLLWFKN